MAFGRYDSSGDRIFAAVELSHFGWSMNDTPTSVPAVSNPPAICPEPVPYQWSLCEYLKTEQRELWDWFSSNRVRKEHAENVRLDLLKSTYRIECESQAALYARTQNIASRFGIAAPITIYQAHTAGDMNAALAYVPGEVHLILHGPVLAMLTAIELDAMLAHELAHFVLYHKWEGEFLVTSEVVRALASDRTADPCHLHTARLLGLYTEIFADRGSLSATGDLSAAVTALVKLHTGLAEVSAESYLRQAEEIFSKSRESTRETSHPELFIRARALQLWETQREAAEQEIAHMIEGPAALDSLDLVARQKVAQTTRRLIGRYLAPRWLQTDLLITHARQFFDDFAAGEIDPADQDEDSPLDGALATADPALRDYFCYVLLDFAAADRTLEDVPLSAALVTARQIGLGPRFSEIAAKELGLPKKRFAKIESSAERRVAEAAAEDAAETNGKSYEP
jgi:Zn-dependent protease with chaperone function